MLKKVLVAIAVAVACLAGFAGMIYIMGDRITEEPGYEVFTNNMTPNAMVYELQLTSPSGVTAEQKVVSSAGVERRFIPWSDSVLPNQVQVRSKHGIVFRGTIPEGMRAITITESRTGTRVFVNR